MNRLKEKYLNEVVPSLKEKHGYKSIMQGKFCTNWIFI